MNEQKKTAVTILCEISQEYQDQIGVLRNMEGVQAVTVWEESTQLLEWNGYEAEVMLAGTDPEYLQKQFPEAYSQGKHSSMAWAIVDESMIKQLKDTKKHVIQGYVPEDLLYQTVEINGEKVRIYGINSPEEKQEKSTAFVYMDIEKYKEIVMSDTENRGSVTDTDTLQGESHTDREAYHYRIQVVNEAAAEKVVDTLSLSGIPVQNTEDLEKQQEQRKKDLEKIKKIYGFERKTELTNAKAAVVKALPIEEKEVVFVMDRFGYSKILDKSTYERNEETVLKEYRHIVHCMNTDKVCVFTDTGVMHQIKVQDIPSGRLRDKGTPLDNIGNYDSRNEQILLIAPDRTLKESSLLFVTAASMVKLVDGAEFIVQKKTVASTKLAEGDILAAVRLVAAKEGSINAQIIMQSEEGYFLRFPLEEVTRKKKGAIGIRGMKLQEDDHIKHVYLTGVENEDNPSIIYKEKELVFSKIRLMGRDGKGVKVRR